MTVKIGISLPDETHAAAVAALERLGGSMSGLIDSALRSELARRGAVDHANMLRQADDHERLRRRTLARRHALRQWKAGN